MNKKFAHTILFLGDLMAVGGIYIGYQWVGEVFFEMNAQLAVIEFNKYTGYIFVSIGIPVLHILSIVENLRPKLLLPYKEIIGKGIVLFAILLFASCYALTNWIPHKLETEGYVYCQTTSLRVASRVIVYTIDEEICQEMGPSKYQQLWDGVLNQDF